MLDHVIQPNHDNNHCYGTFLPDEPRSIIPSKSNYSLHVPSAFTISAIHIELYNYYLFGQIDVSIGFN